MSMPSSNDGNNGEDAYYNTANVNEMPHLLSQPSSGAAGVNMPPPHLMWQNQLLSTQYVHSQQPQTHFNEFLYNMHPQAAFAGPSGNQETYSVLPVGHGNFLKVYHCPDATTGGLAGDNSLYHQQPQPAALHQQFHHQQQPTFQQLSQHQHPSQTQNQTAAPTPPIYNSYELFSSTTLMPPPEKPVGFDCDAPPQQQVQPQQNPLFLLNNATAQENNAQVNSTTNMIINKLVNNWSPNLTGGTYSQFGSSVNQISNQHSVNNVEMDVPKVQTTSHQINTNGNNFNATKPVQPVVTKLDMCSTQTLGSNLTPSQQNTTLILDNNDFVEIPVTKNMECFKESTKQNVPVPTVTGAQILAPSNNVVPEVKKRIVAEVKPMRMTYSDVLSKMNSQTAPTQVMNVKNNVVRNGKNSTSPIQTANDRKAEVNNVRRSVLNEENSVQARALKKSPVHESSKENVQTTNIGITKNSKRAVNQINGAVNNASAQQKPTPAQAKQTAKATANDSNGTNNNSKKRSNSKRNGEMDQQTENSKSTKPSTGTATEKDFSGFYNVTAKNNESFRRPSKSTNNINAYSGSNSNSTSNANLRKSSKNSSAYYSNSAATANNQHQSRSRYSNSSLNSSYSYSSKRNRGSNFSSSYGTDNDDAPNPNVELAKKFLRAWFEYTLKILHWLFYLVYDIVVLGFSRVYEQLSLAYDYGLTYAKQLRKDLKQNSNKPSIWLKEYWKRFDARFKKDSRWAFWRRFYKKKAPEVTKEPFKTGRLPQTGEEAMYSLLNCKGKDAYSILGVPPDSSQEQIRKHYKKIAVLVHPDKNKQAGAEEAFKVLQRAFELIGEPENRLAYDQSLVEALHAEKAWTELHDLLSQLQTKITEAANTIRCSTCGLRHPRKLTDRPHYAARECASCKIRHSAREGDIWAETSFLGLRWKYLALMEGKVYDITEWANCQKGALSHLEPNSHMVQYRIVRGAQQQQQQQASQNYQQNSPHRHGQQYPHGSGPNTGNTKYKRDMPSDDSLHDFLDNLYSGQHPNQSNSANYSNSSRRRTRRN